MAQSTTNQLEQPSVICLDGPSGVGKGTVCLALAKKLNWHILDSGSLYRITALQASRDFPQTDIEAIDETLLVAMVDNLSIKYQQKHDELIILLAGENVTETIRLEEMGEKASKIAVIKAVRAALLARQRAFLRAPGLVADGRDMGTVVFPEAPLKVFLTANAEQRAQRRYKQLKQKGISANLARLINDLHLRDERDMNRQTAPLKPASDATIIDTSTLTAEQVTEKVMQLVLQRLGVL